MARPEDSDVQAKRKAVARAIRLTWQSLDSHLPWIDLTYHEKHRKRGDFVGGVAFHRRCVREYAEIIKILADSI